MEVTKPTINIRALESGIITDSFGARMQLREGVRAVSYDVNIYDPIGKLSGFRGPFQIPSLKKYLGTIDLRQFRVVSDSGKEELERYAWSYNDVYKPKTPYSVEELPDGRVRLIAGRTDTIYRPLNEPEIKELSDIVNIEVPNN